MQLINFRDVDHKHKDMASFVKDSPSQAISCKIDGQPKSCCITRLSLNKFYKFMKSH